MGVFHVFQIAKVVPNGAEQHRWWFTNYFQERLMHSDDHLFYDANMFWYFLRCMIMLRYKSLCNRRMKANSASLHDLLYFSWKFSTHWITVFFRSSWIPTRMVGGREIWRTSWEKWWEVRVVKNFWFPLELKAKKTCHEFLMKGNRFFFQWQL